MQGSSMDSYVPLLGSLGANYLTAASYSENIQGLCRLCARRYVEDPGCSFGIESGKKQILHMIKTCLPIEIGTSDPYPKRICLECNNYLHLFFQFHNTAIEAQEIFKLRIPYSNTSTSTSKILESKKTNKRRGRPSTKRHSTDEDDLLEKIGSTGNLNANNITDTTHLFDSDFMSFETEDIRNKRGFSKRCVWSTEEKAVMVKHFSSYMQNGTLPSFHLCSMVRQSNPVLRNRSNSIMKAWVYNQQKRQRERNLWSFEGE